MTGIQKLMEVLDLTEDEAKQLMADDEAIDKGEKLFELNADQKQVEKKMRQADRKVDAYGKTTKRERKADDDKAFLLNELFKAILPNCETYEIQNGEREFTFTYHEKKYKVVLSAPRS
jgi:hypothetical protein